MKDSIGFNFAAALRSFLRQDPDVVLVGEIRDKETSEIAIKASLTGHLVLSTLHTNDAVNTISRLVNMGVPNYLIAAALSLIVAQRLARRICPECKEEDDKVTEEHLVSIGFPAEQATRTKVYKGKGCPKCKGTGAKGRQGIYEILDISDKIENAILQNKNVTEISQIAQERVEKVTDYLKEGQEINVKVLDVDARGRIKLSMKEIQKEENPVEGNEQENSSQAENNE
jgi:type IV pilus assembly protein PilB